MIARHYKFLVCTKIRVLTFLLPFFCCCCCFAHPPFLSLIIFGFLILKNCSNIHVQKCFGCCEIFLANFPQLDFFNFKPKTLTKERTKELLPSLLLQTCDSPRSIFGTSLLIPHGHQRRHARRRWQKRTMQITTKNS